MKNSLLFVNLICLLLIVGFISCGGSDDEVASCSIAWSTELADEATTLQNTLTVYSSDPSQANCDAVKAAYQAYIDALRPYGNCTALTGQNRTTWQTFLQELEDEVATVC